MTEVVLTIVGFSILFLMTTAGSALVFFFKTESPKANTLFLGFASGVMIAASVWSLLLPSLSQSEEMFNNLAFLPPVIGFILGGAFLVLIDKIVPHMHSGTGEEEGLKAPTMSKSSKMMLAVTIHNIPEGLAVGFAFGAAHASGDMSAIMSALMLAIGMGLQNFPEGAAVSLPMRASLGSKTKAFAFGALSGAVEPVFAVVGFFLASSLSVLQPWFLAFAAGAMIFVVSEDLIPDARMSEHPHLGTWGVMAGFAVMMVLDVALG